MRDFSSELASDIQQVVDMIRSTDSLPQNYRELVSLFKSQRIEDARVRAHALREQARDRLREREREQGQGQAQEQLHTPATLETRLLELSLRVEFACSVEQRAYASVVRLARALVVFETTPCHHVHFIYTNALFHVGAWNDSINHAALVSREVDIDEGELASSVQELYALAYTLGLGIALEGSAHHLAFRDVVSIDSDPRFNSASPITLGDRTLDEPKDHLDARVKNVFAQQRSGRVDFDLLDSFELDCLATDLSEEERHRLQLYRQQEHVRACVLFAASQLTDDEAMRTTQLIAVQRLYVTWARPSLCLAVCALRRARRTLLIAYRARLFGLADSCADRAVTLAPESPYSHWVKAHTLRAKSHYDEALTSLARAIELAPKVLFFRGRASRWRAERRRRQGVTDTAQVSRAIDRLPRDFRQRADFVELVHEAAERPHEIRRLLSDPRQRGMAAQLMNRVEPGWEQELVERNAGRSTVGLASGVDATRTNNGGGRKRRVGEQSGQVTRIEHRRAERFKRRRLGLL